MPADEPGRARENYRFDRHRFATAMSGRASERVERIDLATGQFPGIARFCVESLVPFGGPFQSLVDVQPRPPGEPRQGLGNIQAQQLGFMQG